MPELTFPYTNVELTEEVNRIPNRYGLVNALGLFPPEQLASRYVRIDFKDGVLVVLSAAEPGAAGQVSEDEAETGKILLVPHFPHLDAIRVGDIQGQMTVVDGQMQMRSLDSETARKLAMIRRHHGVTREYVRIGALRGLIKDGKGRTLYDLFNVFGINKKVVDFVLGTPTTDVRAKCEEVYDHILGNVKGETVDAVEAIVSPSFFNKFISHPNVEKFWIQTQMAPTLANMERARLGASWGRIFEFGNIVLREYKGSMPVRNASNAIVQEANIAIDKGHAYPTGTMSMMRTYDAPANHVDRANVVPPAGEEVFISIEQLKHGQGVEMLTQSNVLAVCKQPECLVEMTTSN